MMDKENFKTSTHRQTRAQLIRKNVAKRQALKRQWDKVCKYAGQDKASVGIRFSYYSDTKDLQFSTSTELDGNYIRLLDEGVVVDGDGFIYAVIAKGTIKKWFDVLPEDFIGEINKDHNSSLSLGTFTKNDLRLVEIGDGRYGVEVNVKLDKELYMTKDLLRMNDRQAVSSEFYANESEYITADKVTGNKADKEQLVPVINEIVLTGYAIVDNPKNANSYNEGLLEKASAEEGNDMDEEVKVDEIITETEAVEAAPEQEAPEVAEASVAEEVAEPESSEETEETVEPAEEKVEELEATEAEPEAEEAVEAEEPKEEFDAAAKVEEVIAKFKAEIAEKDARIAELEAKFSAAEKKKESLDEKLFKILNFSTEDPTVEEGAQSELTSDKATEDAYSAALAEAFKAM